MITKKPTKMKLNQRDIIMKSEGKNMDKEKKVTEVTQEELKENDLEEFAALMEEVGALPKDAREKVSLYAQGVIAMAAIKTA